MASGDEAGEDGVDGGGVVAGELQVRELRGAVLVALLIGARVDAALAQAIALRWVAPRKQWGLLRLERARREHELRDGVDVDDALDLFYGPLYARLLVGLGVPSEEKLRSILALAFDAVFVRDTRSALAVRR